MRKRHVLVLAGTILAMSHSVQASGQEPIRSVSNDFNNDGHGDILWHNASTGEVQIWFMNGSSVIGRQTIVKRVFDLRRTTFPALNIRAPLGMAGSRDFDGDGVTDLLAYSSTGRIEVGKGEFGLVLGDNPRTSFGVDYWVSVLGEDGSEAHVGLPWSIVGANDFNQDGTADILWHNGSTSETQIWHMNRHRLIGRATVLGEDGNAFKVGPPWRIVGTNDFNQDGSADILWYNDSDGEAQIWQMNGHRVSGRATVLGEDGSALKVGPPWRIVGTNDFNRDGTADILWHNTSDGAMQVWLMNGSRVSGRANVLGEDGVVVSVGPPWSIVNH